MNQSASNPNQRNHPGQSDIVNIRKLLLLMVGNWYWFVIILVMAGVGAYLYNKYTIPTYRVVSTLLIEEEEKASMPGIDNNLLKGFGLSPGAKNLDNQFLILTSKTLIRKTLNELPFNSDVYKKGLFKKVSCYPLNPIILTPGPEGAPVNIEFSLEYQDENRFHLSYTDEGAIKGDTFITFGQKIVIGHGSFTIFPHLELQELYKSGDKIYFSFYDHKTLMESYRKRLKVVPVTKDATILSLSLEGTNKSKDILFLDKLVEVFMRNNLEKKNHEAMRIIEFIDEQLVDVSDSLTITENQLQEFRSKNRIMNVSAQAQQIIDQAVVLENEKARLNLESNYYAYLDEYLSKDSNQEVPISPASMGIQDPVLGRLMQELAGLQAEYFSSGIGERNPLQNQLEVNIQNTKQSIQETLQSIKLANSMAQEENAKQIRSLNAQATRLPEKEKQLLGFERRFNLSNVLYTFLLQKRAEAQIQKASNRADNELIDPADSDPKPVAPNTILIYLFAFLLGGGIPFLAIMIGDTIHNKVTSEEDLKAITDLPIVGYIPHSRLSYNTVMLTEPQSRIAESFRSLRTRMEFFTRDVKSPVILVTSSMPGDGKTFSAINLASAYSLAGKKTLIIGFDLRKPTLSKSFNLSETIGLSTYLIGKSSIEGVIVKTEFDNLHIIPSGPIPPNPGELSTTEKTSEMFKILKEKYDFIIVDTAPIGVVSDNYSVATIADATLVMVRHGQTNKHYLKATLTEVQALGINGLSLLVNDFRSNKGSYRYVYNYKYKYLYNKGAK